MDEFDQLDLPDNPTVEGLTLLIGEEALAQLSVDLGGRVLSIPMTPGAHSPIAASIGLPAAQRLSGVWGGMKLEVPTRLGKKQRVLQLCGQGMSINRIASTMLVSRKYVRGILNAKADKNQLNLF